ncbi:DUF805 domain-containing protein [Nocardioides faecalis]|uniref:DUF805 domain-containing protein n=1 Tax=Nocardioides faecalis TaxID=2803858 RepID=UPI003FD81E6E
MVTLLASRMSEAADWAAAILLFLPSLAVGARRLHDTGRTGWWQLLLLIPLLGFLVLVVMWLGSSKHTANRFGEPVAA